jgi:hypothetical protein
MTPTTIPQDTLHTIVNRIPFNSMQAIRLVRYLANNPLTVTVEVNRACALGNISHVARKLNPFLWSFGYQIGCERPPLPIPNRFSEPSGMFLWSIYAVGDCPPVEASEGVLIA